MTNLKENQEANKEFKQKKASIDSLCRQILADKLILAIIMKNSIESYKSLDLTNIANNYIEPNSLKISNKEMDSDSFHPKIKGFNTEDNSVEDGTIYYDILFEAKLPGGTENCLIDINIEVQTNYNPGYPLLKRAIYYCSRMLSSQANQLKMNYRYKGLYKVYSVWICLATPEKLENTMNSYRLTENHLIGETVEDSNNYDMLEVLTLYLGSPNELKKNDFLNTLAVILSKKISPDKKSEFLMTNYNISLSKDIKGRMIEMCNYSDYVLLERDIEIATNMLKKGLDINLINETTGLPIERIKELEEKLKSDIKQETTLFK